MDRFILRRWHKRDGQSVQVGEPLADFALDGTTRVVYAQQAGMVNTCVSVGKMVGAGEVIATIEPIDGEAIYDVAMPDLRTSPVGKITTGLRKLFGRP